MFSPLDCRYLPAIHGVRDLPWEAAGARHGKRPRLDLNGDAKRALRRAAGYRWLVEVHKQVANACLGAATRRQCPSRLHAIAERGAETLNGQGHLHPVASARASSVGVPTRWGTRRGHGLLRSQTLRLSSCPWLRPRQSPPRGPARPARTESPPTGPWKRSPASQKGGVPRELEGRESGRFVTSRSDAILAAAAACSRRDTSASTRSCWRNFARPDEESEVSRAAVIPLCTVPNRASTSLLTCDGIDLHQEALSLNVDVLWK